MAKIEKPIIRHCLNCQWYCNKKNCWDCQVRYVDVNFFRRLRAWLCRFYKQREESDDKCEDSM